MLDENQNENGFENGRGKRGFKDILRDEIRNARDPKVYGRAQAEDDEPVRDDTGATQENQATVESKIFGIEGQVGERVDYIYKQNGDDF